MTDKEKIRQEIKRLYDGEAPKHDQQCDFSDGYFTGIGAISKFLDTLQQEPDKSLEEAAEEYFYRNWSDGSLDIKPQVKEDFKAGAEWQKKQMMKEAVEGEVIKTDKHTSVRYKAFYGTDRYFYGIADKQFKPGDKVRIIIVKGDEK